MGLQGFDADDVIDLMALVEAALVGLLSVGHKLVRLHYFAQVL